MNDPIERVEKLSNAAYEIAFRNHNRWIGPDHLLFVICMTEDGRREIEGRNGDHKAIYSYLSTSFKSRMEEGEFNPEFNAQFHMMLAGPAFQAKDGKISDIDVGMVLKEIIEKHRICPVTTAALIRGGLVDEGDEISDKENCEFEDQVAAAARAMEEIQPQSASPESEAQLQGGVKPDQTGGQEPQVDPHLKAVSQAMRNLTMMAARGELDPVTGRDEEINKVVDILQRRRKGNVLLVGPPGVGKTAIAEGVAQLLEMTDTPASVASRPVVEVSVSDLLAGTRYRGDFEQRLRYLITMARQNNAILFFDEAHMLVGAGASGGSGAVDASNILKPAMARGELQIIAATTSAEARSIRKDKALMRRFEMINVQEPDRDTSVKILKQVEEPYSAHHGISYEEGVAEACVDMAIKHIPDRQLPDKALDLLDMAAVEAKNAGSGFVTPEFVTEAVTALTGVNVGRPTQKDLRVIKEFPDRMKKGILGQGPAMETLSRAIRISGTGISRSGVAGSYLFNGPTGVGKTEAARKMADSLGIPLVRVDMSEYMEPHSVSGLIGAPPGYVGYDDDGVLIAAAEMHPRMVLLLDEVEKAHPKVFDILLQILDYGRLSSPDGRTVSMRGVHLVMTANIGSQEAEKPSIGFGRKTDENEVSKNAIAKTFRKELLARIKYKIQFQKLDEEAIDEMVAAKIAAIQTDLTERGFKVAVQEDVSKFITGEVMKEGATGRVVADQIDLFFADPISAFVVENEDVSEMQIAFEDGEIKVSEAFH